MLDIFKVIEEQARSKEPRKIIFTGIKFNIIFYTLFILTFSTLIPVMFYEQLGLDFYFVLGFIILFSSCFSLFFFGFVNPYAKKKLQKLNIEVNKKWWKHWANENYHDYRFGKFHTDLLEKKVLSGQSDDICLLKEYADLFKEEAENYKRFEVYKVFGGLLLVFLLPIWNRVLSLIYHIKNFDLTKDFGQIFEMTGIIILIIFSAVLTIVYVRSGFKELLETRNRKLSQIYKELLNLKWNVELQESKK